MHPGALVYLKVFCIFTCAQRQASFLGNEGIPSSNTPDPSGQGCLIEKREKLRAGGTSRKRE